VFYVVDGRVQLIVVLFRSAAVFGAAIGEQTLDALERLVDGLQKMNLGSIAIACTLGYLDCPLPLGNWHDGRPNSSAWFAEFSKRQSMIATKPPAPL